MAITTPTLAGAGTHPIEVDCNLWAANFHSANYAGAGLSQELKAAPTRTNSALYLTHVTMGIVADSTWHYEIDNKVSLIDGDGTVLFGPIQLQAQGAGLFQKDFDKPLKITDGKSLKCKGVYGGGSYNTASFVYVEGFTGDVPLG